MSKPAFCLCCLLALLPALLCAQCSLDGISISTSDFMSCDSPANITFSAQLDLNSSPTEYSYNWQFSDGASSALEEPTVVFVEPEVYSASLTVTDLVNGCSVSDTYQFELTSIQVIEETIRVCASESYQLPSGVYVIGAGVYNYQDVDEDGCPRITITTLQVVPDYDLEIEVLTCDPFVVIEGTEVNVGRKYISYNQTAEGCDSVRTYYVDSDDAEVVFDDPVVPNAFSPNGDGLNDTFRPILQLKPGSQLLDYQFEVFDRWGKQLYHTSYPQGAWEGVYKGEFCQMDHYTWQILMKVSECNKTRDIKLGGAVFLLR